MSSGVMGLRPATARPNLGPYAHELMSALAQAMRLPPSQVAAGKEVLAFLTARNRDLVIGSQPAWPSDLGDDGTPIEFSVAFRGAHTEVRWMAEAQRFPLTPMSSWEAGVATNEALLAESLADLGQFDRIRDLFCPSEDSFPRFSLWHGAQITEEGEVAYKVYVNPLVLGPGAPNPVPAALERLEATAAVDFLDDLIGAGVSLDALKYFSVDLVPAPRARVKFYIGCYASDEEVGDLASRARNISRESAIGWLQDYAGSRGPYHPRPIWVCFAFRRGQILPDATVHIPIRSHVDHDAQALRRIAPRLSATQFDCLTAAVDTLASRPLEKSRGVITYVSLRPEAEGACTTVYLNPRLYG